MNNSNSTSDLITRAFTDPNTIWIFMVVKQYLSIFSIVVCAIAITFMLKKWKFKITLDSPTKEDQLVFYLILLNLFQSISQTFIFDYQQTYQDYFIVYCGIQGIILEFTTFGMICWTSAISINLWLTVNKKKPEMIHYHLVIWGLDILVTFLPFISGPYVYNLSGIWCWISINYTAWRTAVFYGPYIFLSGLILLLNIHIYIKSKTIAEGNENQIKKYKKFALYPICLFLIFIIPTVNRFVEDTTDQQVFVLFLIHIICQQLLGIVNGLVYAYIEYTDDEDDDVRSHSKGSSLESHEDKSAESTDTNLAQKYVESESAHRDNVESESAHRDNVESESAHRDSVESQS